MSDPPPSTREIRESLLQAEVERAIAPYVGVAPPAVLAKMRELAERYYRTHPEAAAVINALTARPVLARSEELVRDEQDGYVVDTRARKA